MNNERRESAREMKGGERGEGEMKGGEREERER